MLDAKANASTSCGVYSYTWGSHPGRINGLVQNITTRWSGGNIGHTSGKIVIPVNEHTSRLIKRYCDDPKIPYVKTKLSTPRAVLGEDGFEASDDTLYSEEVYIINWSFWPDDTRGFQLGPCNNEDGLSERMGVNRPINPNYVHLIGDYQQYYHGTMGKTLMSQGAIGFVHERGLSKLQVEYLNLTQQRDILHSKCFAINTFLMKMMQKEDLSNDTLQKQKFTPNERLILKRYMGNGAEQFANMPLSKSIVGHFQTKGITISNELDDELEALEEKIKFCAKKLKAQNGMTDTFTLRQHEAFSTRGAPADHVVHLPLDKSFGFKHGHDFGLNLQAMLEQMHHIVMLAKYGHAFDMYENNCANTWLSILEKGAKTTHLKNQLNKRALGAISNPQVVFDNTKYYLASLDNPLDTKLNLTRDIDLIGKVTGYCVNTLVVESKPSPFQKIAAGVLIGPALGMAGLWHGIKWLASWVASSVLSVGYAIKNTLFDNRIKSEHVDISEQAIDTMAHSLKVGQSLPYQCIEGSNLRDILDDFYLALKDGERVAYLGVDTKRRVDKTFKLMKEGPHKKALLHQYHFLCEQAIKRVNALHSEKLALVKASKYEV